MVFQLTSNSSFGFLRLLLLIKLMEEDVLTSFPNILPPIVPLIQALIISLSVSNVLDNMFDASTDNISMWFDSVFRTRDSSEVNTET